MTPIAAPRRIKTEPASTSWMAFRRGASGGGASRAGAAGEAVAVSDATLRSAPGRLPSGLTSWALGLAALGLAACAGPSAPRIYTLQDPSSIVGGAQIAPGSDRLASPAAAGGVSTAAGNTSAGAGNASASGPTRFIDVAPVIIPERLRRRQLVLRTDATQLRVLEEDRWSASLADELHDAISFGLQSQLNAADVSQTGLAGKAPSYRISIEFNQLDAQQGGAVRANVSWLVKQVSGPNGRVCQARFDAPAGAQVADVIVAHQRIVGQVVDAVAASQRALESGGTAPYCSASVG